MTARELDDLVALLRSKPKPDVLTPEGLRERIDKLAEFLPKPADLASQVVDVAGVTGEIFAAPGSNDEECVLYLHGGGYVIGSIDTHRILTHELSRASGARVLSLEYGLAPERPFPGGLEDAVTGYRWLLDGGTAPEKIVIAGDSAGGGLTVATLLSLRDQGLPLPAGGVCFSPWVDMEGQGESMVSRAEADPLVQKEGLLWYAEQYLAGADPRHPLASPLHADLSGLPPMLIQVGDAETLLDDSIRLAERARAAGVTVELDVWDQMIHVWQLFGPLLSEGRDAINQAGAYIAARVGG